MHVLLVMIVSLVLIPVSGSNASILPQSDIRQQAIEMLHSSETQHESQHHVSFHDSEKSAEHSSHMHDGNSSTDCCSLNCGSVIIADARFKTNTNPSESHILPAHRLLLPSEWDTQLRPPKI